MAKTPLAGRVKTRLSPPLSPAEAALVAEAALKDTLDAVLAAGVNRRILALEGPPLPWLPSGIDVVPQRGRKFGDRLINAVEDVGGAALVIGMDTPQITPGLLSEALERLMSPGADAVLGLSKDGGWWALGLREWHPEIFHKVPMSRSTTGSAQMQQLEALKLTVFMLPTLRDIDLWEDVSAVAREIPDSYLSSTLAELNLVDMLV